jgi:hypothetical protein
VYYVFFVVQILLVIGLRAKPASNNPWSQIHYSSVLRWFWWASKTRPHPTVHWTFQFGSSIVAQTFRSLKTSKKPVFCHSCPNVVVVSNVLSSEIGDSKLPPGSRHGCPNFQTAESSKNTCHPPMLPKKLRELCSIVMQTEILGKSPISRPMLIK